MSESSGKVCCNCRHNIRHYEDEGGACYCDIDNHYIGYIECMEGWCRHWSKEEERVQMAKMPTMDEWAERLGNKAINEYVYEGRTLKEWIDLMASGKLVILPDNATNGDVIKAICSMWIAYHDTDIEVTVDKKVWDAPYKVGDTEWKQLRL